MRPALFDTHTHIQGPEFDADRADTIRRARAAGLTGMLVLGWDVPSSERAIELAGEHEGVLAAAGCHPHDARHMDSASLDRLAGLAADARVVAVGEIGLDFYRNLSPREAQIRVFERQLQTAADGAKPVAVHCRDAHETLLPIVEAWSKKLAGRTRTGGPLGVMHHFSGDVALGKRYIELGFLISVHTSVTHPKSDRLRDVARGLPLSALVVETDSPYGAPQAQRGRRNEPAYVIEAVRAVAEARGEPVERVAEATAENAERLFGLPAQPAAAAAGRARQGVEGSA